MKKKSLLILLVGVLALLVVTGIGTTYAWLTDQGESSTISYEVGDVSYQIAITKAENAGDIVVPGQSLTDISIKNKSNIITQLRVQMTVKCGDETWTVGEYSADPLNKTDHILITKGTGWTSLTGGYYYYGDADSTKAAANIPVSTDITNGVEIADLWTKLEINGWKVGNTYSGKTITVILKFQAKQAEYVTWADMGSVSFETGLA